MRAGWPVRRRARVAGLGSGPAAPSGVDAVADTAFAIAAIRAEESARPAAERLFEDPYASLFRPTTAAAEAATQRTIQLAGFRERVRLRTRFIDEVAREALGAGLTQMVLLGAGFDARGLRMPEIAAHHATVFEIDTPAQLARKRAALDAAGIAIPAAIAHIPIDFATHDLEEALLPALEARGFQRGTGALFVWEGVVGYIDSAMVDRSLRFMAGAGGPRSRLVFTFSDLSLDPYPARLRALRAGFTTFEEHGFAALWRRFFAGEPLPAVLVSSIGVAAIEALAG